MKIKSAPAEANAPKTQTPTVAKQVEIETRNFYNLSYSFQGICVLHKSKNKYEKKGYSCPIDIKIPC